MVFGNVVKHGSVMLNIYYIKPRHIRSLGSQEADLDHLNLPGEIVNLVTLAR